MNVAVTPARERVSHTMPPMQTWGRQMLSAAGQSPPHEVQLGPRYFSSTTQAVLRYIELYRLLSTPRSIPLGTKKTHVGKTDSAGRWRQIRHEFAELCMVFPKSHTEDWYLLVVNQMTNLMTAGRIRAMEELTGLHWTRSRFERRSNHVFHTLAEDLRSAGFLTPAAERAPHEALVENKEAYDYGY